MKTRVAFGTFQFVFMFGEIIKVKKRNETVKFSFLFL